MRTRSKILILNERRLGAAQAFMQRCHSLAKVPRPGDGSLITIIYIQLISFGFGELCKLGIVHYTLHSLVYYATVRETPTRSTHSLQEPANRGGTPFDRAAQQEQSYRSSIREKNRKYCDNFGGNYGFGGGGGGGRGRGAGGICRSEKSSAAAKGGGDATLMGGFWRG